MGQQPRTGSFVGRIATLVVCFCTVTSTATASRSYGDPGVYRRPYPRIQSEKETIEAIRMVCPETPGAIPLFLHRMDDQNERRWSETMILSIGSEAIPVLVEQLDEDGQIAENAASILAAFGPGAHDAVPELIEALRRGNNSAATALADMGPEAGQVIPDMIQALQRGNKGAARVLAALGQEAKPALTPLIEALRRGNDAAITVLGAIGPDARDAVPLLIEATRHGQKDAVVALGKIGPEARAAVSILLELLQKKERPKGGKYGRDQHALKEHRTRQVCPYALGTILADAPLDNKLAREAVEILVDVINVQRDNQDIRDYDIYYHSIVALGRIGPVAAETITLLVDIYSDDPSFKGDKVFACFGGPEEQCRGAAGRSLEWIGISAVPALVELTGKGGHFGRHNVLRILERIEAKYPEIREDTEVAGRAVADKDRRENTERPEFDFKTVRLKSTEKNLRFLDTKTHWRIPVARVFLADETHRKKAESALLDILRNPEGCREAGQAAVILDEWGGDLDRDEIAEALARQIPAVEDPDYTNVASAFLRFAPEKMREVLLDPTTVMKQQHDRWDQKGENGSGTSSRNRALRLAGFILMHDRSSPEAWNILFKCLRSADAPGGAFGLAYVPGLIPYRDEPGFPKDELIGSLMDGLEKQTIHRSRYINILGEFGPSAGKAVPALERLLRAKDYYIRSRAVIALKKIRYPTPE